MNWYASIDNTDSRDFNRIKSIDKKYKDVNS